MSQLVVAPLPEPVGDDWRQWAQLLVHRLSVELTLMRAVINGRLTFGDGTSPDNMEGVWLTAQVTNATPDTESSFTHNLGRVPIGLIVVKRDKAGVIYSGGTSWTTTTLTLRSNLASVTFTAWVVAAPTDVQ